MENPNFIFSSGPIELKKEEEDYFVEGYISTSDLDLVNDVVTKDCIMDMADQMKSRTIKMDLEHESFRGESEVELEINKTLIPAAKIDDFLVDKKGMRVRAMLNRHVARFNELKNSIKDGFVDAFSIAFIPVKSRIEERNGQEIRMLDKINLLNVAFTGNPVNTRATMTNIFAKSLQFLKEKEDHVHASDNITQKEVKNMTEEKEETQTEESEKPSEESESEKESGDESEAEKKAKKQPKEEEEDEDKKVAKKDDEAEEESKEEDSTEESEESESKETETEEKSEIAKLKKDMMEVKAVLKAPIMKSKVEQKDKSDNFVEEKALNPLDVIA